jgi:AraC family transcriptional regulator
MTATELVARTQRTLMEPKIERKPAFSLVGMVEYVTPTTTHRIATLWDRFGPRMSEIPYRRGGCAFGVGLDDGAPPGDPLGFRYVAAVEVDAIEDVPAGMIAVPVAASTYAVFTHRGHITKIGDTVKQVWTQWLPTSKYRHVPAPDFEYYDARFDPETGNGEVDIYVPVADDA